MTQRSESRQNFRTLEQRQNEVSIEVRQTAEKTNKSNKKIIVFLLIVIGVLLIAVGTVLGALIMQSRENREKPSVKRQEMANETIEDSAEYTFGETKTDAKAEKISDSVYGVEYMLNVNIEHMEDTPTYRTVMSEKMQYSLPDNFSNIDSFVNESREIYRYGADDNTAFVQYSVSTAEYTAAEALERQRNILGGKVHYEACGDTWYALSVINGEMSYYIKCIIDDGREGCFECAFPYKYIDVYDGYIEQMEKDFKLTVN